LIELLVVVAIIALLVSILLPSLGKAREQAKRSFCANNLGQFGRAVHIYQSEYKYYPPHAPYPQWLVGQTIQNMPTGGWDPNLGWLMTYAMRMQPPRKSTDPKCLGHFIWYLMSEDEIPDICVCPAARRELMFQYNPEIPDLVHDGYSPLESFLYQYAAFYITSGTIRCGCPITQARTQTQPGLGGTNPPIPDPTNGKASGQAWNNCQRGSPPYIYCFTKDPSSAMNEDTPLGGTQGEPPCWVQAVDPSQIDNPGRVYYMAEGREYRPQPKTTSAFDQPPGTFYHGWYVGWGNQCFLGTRHSGFGNVAYMDGHTSSDNQWHDPRWNLAYNPNGTNAALSDVWRVGTFADDIRIANVRKCGHLMPVLMVRGWEWFFTSLGNQ
jgi:prepilin-type processing-associated H-X9-DG protein